MICPFNLLIPFFQPFWGKFSSIIGYFTLPFDEFSGWLITVCDISECLPCCFHLTFTGSSSLLIFIWPYMSLLTYQKTLSLLSTCRWGHGIVCSIIFLFQVPWGAWWAAFLGKRVVTLPSRLPSSQEWSISLLIRTKIFRVSFVHFTWLSPADISTASLRVELLVRSFIKFCTPFPSSIWVSHSCLNKCSQTE